MLSYKSVKGGRSEGGDILRRSFLAAQEKSFIHLKGGEGGKVMMRKHARLKKPFVQNWAHTFFLSRLYCSDQNAMLASAFYRDLTLDGHETYLVELAKVNRKGHGSGIFPPPAKWSNTVVDHQSRSEVVLTSGLVIPHLPLLSLAPTPSKLTSSALKSLK